VLIIMLIRIEENELRRVYNEQYARYQQMTKKLFPLIY
jgi:protein-S-isoprenylcysteine O-methyltransferase Ste14